MINCNGWIKYDKYIEIHILIYRYIDKETEVYLIIELCMLNRFLLVIIVTPSFDTAINTEKENYIYWGVLQQFDEFYITG